MAKRMTYTPDQIVAKLHAAKAHRARGASVPEVCGRIGVTPNTYFRWNTRYGGMSKAQARRVAKLEQENENLRLVLQRLGVRESDINRAAKGKLL